jgi:uncharacterized membrane protein (DUF106 family)
MMKNYLKKVIGMLMVAALVICWIQIFNELVWDEIEDYFNPDLGVFKPEDFFLGTTIILSLTYSVIRIIEGIFKRKEKKEES